MLSQVSQLPATQMVEAISLKGTHADTASDENSVELSVGGKGISFKGSEKQRAENQKTGEAGLNVTTTYDQLHTPSSLALLLERKLDEHYLVEDFNRRVVEVMQGWQDEVKRFADTATGIFKFREIEALLQAAAEHARTLIQLYIEDFRERRMPNSTSRLVKANTRSFHWCSRPEGDSHFRFTAEVTVRLPFGNYEDSQSICTISGAGHLDNLIDGAKELVKEQGVIESAEILGKFLRWSQEPNEMIVLPIFIK